VPLLVRTFQIVLGPTESTFRKLTDRKNSSSSSGNYSSTVAPPYKPAHTSARNHTTAAATVATAGAAAGVNFSSAAHKQQHQEQQQQHGGANNDNDSVIGPESDGVAADVSLTDVAALTSLERGVTVVMGSQADLAGTVRCTLHTTTTVVCRHYSAAVYHLRYQFAIVDDSTVLMQQW
jgi:hypothetical protein